MLLGEEEALGAGRWGSWWGEKLGSSGHQSVPLQWTFLALAVKGKLRVQMSREGEMQTQRDFRRLGFQRDSQQTLCKTSVVAWEEALSHTCELFTC